MSRGQAIVEFALIFPIACLGGLVFAESAMLLDAVARQGRDTAVVVQWAAVHPGDDWHAVASAQLPGCSVDVQPSAVPDVLVATATCRYVPKITRNMWAGADVSTREEAAVVEP